MTVIPPGLDFSNLKVDCPPDPWQQLAAAAAGGAGAERGSVQSRKGSVASVLAEMGGEGATGEGRVSWSYGQA
jgi:hypothetical protein